MRAAAIVVVVVALVLAGVTAFFAQSMLSGGKKTVAEEQFDSGRIIVADKDLPAGTIITEKHIRWQKWPKEGRDPGYLAKPQQEGEIVGTAVKRGIGAGEPLTLTKVFKPGEAGFLAGALQAGRRAIGIQVNQAASAAGFIRPGDHVDVILTQSMRRKSNGGAPLTMSVSSETILRNVRVLAVDQSINDVDKKAKAFKTATVEVTPKQAEALTLATRMGNLSLSLRSLMQGDETTPQSPFTSDLDVSEALRGGLSVADESDPNTVRVLAAADDLQPGALLRESSLTWSEVPLSDKPADIFLVEGKFEKAAFLGGLVRSPVKKGSPLRADAVIAANEPGFVSAVLAPGMRAVTVDKAAVSAIEGFAAAGDRVDVVLTQELKGADGSGSSVARHTSETVLKDRRIVALNRGGGTAAIEVSPEESAQLEVARSMGRISLALRSGTDAGRDAGNVSAVDTDVSAAFGRKIAAGPKKAIARVLVAAEELPAGVLVRDTQLEWRSVASLPAGNRFFLEGRDERDRLHGALLKEPLAAGQPIPNDAIMMPGDPGFMAKVLMPGRRAASIGIDAVTGISGFVSPGDYVDVVLTQELQQDKENFTGAALKKRLFSETILQNLRILAIKQTIDNSSGQPVAAHTATLEVDPEKAQVLAVAEKMGKLSLSLRGNGGEAEARIPYSTDVGVSGQLAEWVGGAPRRSTPSAPVVARSAPADAKFVVKVYKGATASEQAF